MSIPRLLLFPLAASLALVVRRLIPAGGCCSLAFTRGGERRRRGPAPLDRALPRLLYRYLRAGEPLPHQCGLQVIHPSFELTGALGIRRDDDGSHLVSQYAHPDAGLPAIRVRYL